MDGESWAVGRREAPICDASDWRSHGLTGEKLQSRRLVGYFQGRSRGLKKRVDPNDHFPFREPCMRLAHDASFLRLARLFLLVWKGPAARVSLAGASSSFPFYGSSYDA